MHSAASVSFDSPLDAAVEVNLLGPSRVAAAFVAARELAVADGRRGPVHFVPVSTAYVASTHQGEAKEELLDANPFTVEVDWRHEVAAARRQRGDSEAESRRPERLTQFHKAAREELGGAGLHLLAERAERLREDWVKKQMVSIGQARAQSLGWPDAYPYTKALGERALVAQFGDTVPITVIRPSIIESALAEPRPGWIRGFRMAEPIIISYARGLLREFPGVPEGVTDVIPVDLVVAAIIAVSGEALLHADSDDPADAYAGPSVYHVASGVRNPFRYGRLVELVTAWFTEHPLYDQDGQPIVVPEWSFPGRGRVQRQLTRASKAMSLAERVVGSLPIRGKQAEWMAALEEQHLLADRALGYVELYGAYTETDALYRVDRLLALWDRMDEDDRAAFCLDPAAVDWATYVNEIHLPSIIEHARVRTSPGKSVKTNRADRARKNILSPDRHLAAFDLENTLIASNVVDSYAWLASRHLPAGERAAFVADLLAEAPALLALDRRDRGDFLRSFYRRYDGAPVDRLRDDGWDLFHHLLLAKSFPAGIARVRAHQALGHRTILITGALDFVVEPFRPLFDEIVCARLGEADGCFTGRLELLPPIGEARALVLADYAESEGLQLEESHGLRRLGQRPAHARGRRLPGGRQPGGQAGRHRPTARLARGDLAQGRRRRRAGAPPRPPRSARRLGTGPHQPGSSGRPSTPHLGEAHDEGPGGGAERAAVRGGSGGVDPGFGAGRGHRSAAAARRGGPRPTGRRLVPAPSAPVRHLRVRPGHPGRPDVAILRGPGVVPVRAGPRGGGRPRRRRHRPRRRGHSPPAPGP